MLVPALQTAAVSSPDNLFMELLNRLITVISTRWSVVSSGLSFHCVESGTLTRARARVSVRGERRHFQSCRRQCSSYMCVYMTGIHDWVTAKMSNRDIQRGIFREGEGRNGRTATDDWTCSRNQDFTWCWQIFTVITFKRAWSRIKRSFPELISATLSWKQQSFSYFVHRKFSDQSYKEVTADVNPIFDGCRQMALFHLWVFFRSFPSITEWYLRVVFFLSQRFNTGLCLYHQVLSQGCVSRISPRITYRRVVFSSLPRSYQRLPLLSPLTNIVDSLHSRRRLSLLLSPGWFRGWVPLDGLVVNSRSKRSVSFVCFFAGTGHSRSAGFAVEWATEPFGNRKLWSEQQWPKRLKSSPQPIIPCHNLIHLLL